MSEQGGSGLSFRLGPFPVHMPWSSLVGIGIITYFWLDFFRNAFQYEPGGPDQAYVLTAVFAVLFYATILGHEVAHAVVAQASGFPVSGITLWWLGGFTSFRRTRPSPLRDGLIAAAGPLSSLGMGLIFWAVSRATLDGDRRIYVIAFALAWSNVFLAIYNALPGLPLDGGNVLRAVVWGVSGRESTGSLVAGWAGRVVAVVLVALPLWDAVRRGGSPDVLAIVFTVSIGIFLWQGASHAIRSAQVSGRVPGLSARALARPAAAVAADTPLSEALRQASLVSADRLVVVDAQGRPTGIAAPAAVDAVPVERRPWVPVSSVAAAFDPRAVLSADLTGNDLLTAMNAVPSPTYLVVDGADGSPRVLATADVEQALASARTARPPRH
jgi:Zn-dependent protease